MGVQELFDWLVDGTPGISTPADVVARIGTELQADGVPVERIVAFVTTLHPDVHGRVFRWSPESGASLNEIGYETTQSAMFQESAIAHIVRGKSELRRVIQSPETPRDFSTLHDLAGDGFTDYFGVPLVFTTGQAHGITFATRRAGGFVESDLDAFRRIARPLARVAEILALRRTATTLLSTYVGRNAGDRVLSGRIKKGDIEDIRAVIWFSDLRGFTQLSQRSTAREVIDVLNQAFECQVAAVDRRGGEVLKFMGDGMLAILPLVAGCDVAERCDAAIAAAEEAQAAFALLRPDLGFGIALHVGDIAYGNIGGHGRLDFTAIGPAVNLAARIETLTGRLERPLLVSTELAAHTTRATVSVGTFELKGVDGPVPVHALADR